MRVPTWGADRWLFSKKRAERWHGSRLRASARKTNRPAARVHGDEIEQVDRRAFYGAKVSYRVLRELAGVRFDTSFGAEVRSDDIHGAALPASFSSGKHARLAPAPGGVAGGGFYGCEDVAYTPAYPLTARLTATLYLD